ncbi:MAG: phosphoribosylanthranilate isomerase [Halioglobus sp.]|nr:phosphoribosylanthranilate isomerase [Halioglobus sp.]
MTHTRTKICGITRPEDAQAAVRSGADAIGLVFYAGSPRAVTAARAAEIARQVPPFVSVVALFVDAPPAEVRRVLDAVPVDLLQFHGSEDAAYCGQFQRPWLKALSVRPGLDIDGASRAYGAARGLLLDAWRDGVPGGTGQTFDWNLAPRALRLPLVLAGGLHAGNVGAAIAALRPAAVDVSGGVERAPGLKCAQKIARFVAAVRAADQQVDGMHDDQ